MAGPLVERLPLWLAATNAWIVAPDGAGGVCVLVDAPPEPGVIMAQVAELGLRVVAVLVTHGHVDHVGGVGAVTRLAEAAHDGRGHAPGERVRAHIHHADRHMLIDVRGAAGAFAAYLPADLDLRPPEIVDGLDDGQQVSGAGMTFTAVHTPGHTPGSTCLRLAMAGMPPLLFSGDHLFAGSIGRTDLPGGSMSQLVASMIDRILPLPDGVVVHPGHGPSTTLGHERATNPFLLQMINGTLTG